MFFVISSLLALVGCHREQSILVSGKSIGHWTKQTRDADPNVRREAVDKLGNVGDADPAVLPALLAALKDPSASVRRAAIVGILKSHPTRTDVGESLATMHVNDRDPIVRQYAGAALQKLGQEPNP